MFNDVIILAELWYAELTPGLDSHKDMEFHTYHIGVFSEDGVEKINLGSMDLSNKISASIFLEPLALNKLGIIPTLKKSTVEQLHSMGFKFNGCMSRAELRL